MSRDETITSASLERWHQGDAKGLETLIQHHLPWIEAQVRRRMGPLLRSKGDTVDYLQDAMLEFLRFAPRFTLSSDEGFRALLLRIVENSMRNRYDWFTARRRDIARERPLPSDTVLSLDPAATPTKTPSKSAERHEREAWVRLGMELIDPDEREVLVLRQWEGLSFREIGKRLGTSEDAARMRHSSAVKELARKVQALRAGRLSHVLEESNG